MLPNCTYTVAATLKLWACTCWSRSDRLLVPLAHIVKTALARCCLIQSSAVYMPASEDLAVLLYTRAFAQQNTLKYICRTVAIQCTACSTCISCQSNTSLFRYATASSVKLDWRKNFQCLLPLACSIGMLKSIAVCYNGQQQLQDTLCCGSVWLGCSACNLSGPSVPFAPYLFAQLVCHFLSCTSKLIQIAAHLVDYLPGGLEKPERHC